LVIFAASFKLLCIQSFCKLIIFNMYIIHYYIWWVLGEISNILFLYLFPLLMKPCIGLHMPKKCCIGLYVIMKSYVGMYILVFRVWSLVSNLAIIKFTNFKKLWLYVILFINCGCWRLGSL
jgi:hypothetical protein